VLDGDLDDFVAGKISSDGGILTTLANDVGFVGLCYQIMLAKKKKKKQNSMTEWWVIRKSYSVGACSDDPHNWYGLATVCA
jgi:hypothetical protein